MDSGSIIIEEFKIYLLRAAHDYSVIYARQLQYCTISNIDYLDGVMTPPFYVKRGGGRPI